MSIVFRPKYISFDCYGTLIYFQMAPVARQLFADRIRAEDMDQFCKDFSAFRLDEVLGDWQPYYDVVYNSVLRTANRWGVPFRESDVAEIYADGPGAHWLTNPLSVAISRRPVNANTRWRLVLASGGGQAIRIRPTR